jgi:hypothetical protein
MTTKMTVLKPNPTKVRDAKRAFVKEYLGSQSGLYGVSIRKDDEGYCLVASGRGEALAALPHRYQGVRVARRRTTKPRVAVAGTP